MSNRLGWATLGTSILIPCFLATFTVGILSGDVDSVKTIASNNSLQLSQMQNMALDTKIKLVVIEERLDYAENNDKKQWELINKMLLIYNQDLREHSMLYSKDPIEHNKRGGEE
jgi:hypothetical protein